ncbi:MAG: pyridoxal-phosphate dependent enzyme [Tissierellia bacterium]|nr:pyridoxal-phosphate dependent enzyme [Tissierellia bacterium]
MKSTDLNAILSSFPTADLLDWDTPIQRLKTFERLLNKSNLFIKRDDLTGVGAGGNKVRNIKYLLGDALQKEADLIIASGQRESNLCLATAAACAKMGMDCILVHNNDSDFDTGNMRLNRILGVQPHFIGNVSEEERNEYIENLTVQLQEQGRRPYVIENGGTTPIGCLGHVELANELAKQQSNHCFQNVFVCGGNGGMAAGLIFGSYLLGNPFKTFVISVENDKITLDSILDKLFNEIQHLLRLPAVNKADLSFEIIEDYMGEGWGHSTEESTQMIFEFSRNEGIFIEGVYMAKTAFGTMDLLQRSIDLDGACLIHSGGFPSIFSQMI